ncbi:MAG: hypothetical protein AAF715_30920 [Myxococcota bacterium]
MKKRLRLTNKQIMKIAVMVWFASLMFFALPFAFALEGVAEEAHELPPPTEDVECVTSPDQVDSRLCHFIEAAPEDRP